MQIYSSKRKLFTLGLVHTTPEKFENAVLFVWLDLPSTRIHHEIGAFHKHSSNQRHLKTAACENIFLHSLRIHQNLNKGNHDCDGVWISDLNQHRFLRFYLSVFSLVLVSVEKIYQTLKTVFDHISKHLKFRQKYSAAPRIFNSLVGVWKRGQTLSFGFDILLENETFRKR